MMKEGKQTGKGSKCAPPRIYKDNRQHLADELKKLDLLILRRVMAMRQQVSKMRELTVDPKLFVSHAEIDHLLRQEGEPADRFSGYAQISKNIETLRQDINGAVLASMKNRVFLALPQLEMLFNLSPFELQVIVICLAPELRRKYDKIFVYLQDDIARKRPSIHLVLDLLCAGEAEQWEARRYFSSQAPLFRNGILQVLEDPHSPSGSSDLARFLKIDARIFDFIMGNNTMDSSLSGLARLHIPSLAIEHVPIDKEIKDRVVDIAHGCLAESVPTGKKLVFYFYGPHGVGKRELALAMCRTLNCYLLFLDMEMVATAGTSAGTLLRTAFREGLLQQVLLYIGNMDCLLTQETQSRPLLKTVARLAAEFGWITVLAGNKQWTPNGLFDSVVFYSVRFNLPQVHLRQEVWEKELETTAAGDKTNRAKWSGELARQFLLTPGQIRDAVEFARCRYLLGGRKKKLTLPYLYTAARSQSNRKLQELSVKIAPKHGWQDIVLTEEKIKQLKEICSQVRYRHLVFSQWGFREKISHGKGLSVLFSGSPGTGKTLAAEVMAGELQLDLYKIDLSGVVSKYIGETEKNLSRVFKEAETSNAILFFDEADALFGKRTEVSDAHDRYANIETSYLLQKMEEYEGIVILATNLRKNMDEAFTRRIRFIVEFPFPDEASRCRIWKTHFPVTAPVSETIDYDFLARQFPLAGGNIRNIVLNAAFFAAQNGGAIEMQHILNGARREFEKIGKLWKDISPGALNIKSQGE